VTVALPRGDVGARARLAAQAAVVAVALALRVPNLTTGELYRDDAWPALAARVDLGHAIRLGVTVPGFELFLRTWLAVSRSTLWAQLPALAASVLGVVLAYRIAHRLGAGHVGGLVAAAVLAVSPIAVLYATRVKQYPFDALDALLLVACAVWVRDEPASRRRWLTLLVLAVAAVVFSASVLPVALVTLGFAASAARRGTESRRVAATCVAVYGAFVALWAWAVLRSVPPPLHDSWDANYIHHSSPWRLVTDTWHVLDQFAAGIFYRHGPTGPLLLVALAIGLVVFRRGVAVLLLGPVALAVVLAALERVPLGGGRIDLYLYPGVALAAGVVVHRLVELVPALADRAAAVNVGVVVVVVAFAATAGLRQTRSTPYPSGDVRRLTAGVRERAAPGDAIVVSQFSRYPYALYAPARPRIVFSRSYSTGFTVASTEPDVLVMPAEYYEPGYDADAAVRFAAGRARVWYIATDTPAFDTPPVIQRNEYVAEDHLVAAGYRVTDRIEGHGGHADLLVAP
jgi:hypothetical protein